MPDPSQPARPNSPVLTLPQAAYWLAPSLFCLILYWHGLLAWYQQDDFIWLWQARHVNSWREWAIALFRPTGHGTFRPLSERLTFILFWRIAGTDPFPFHLLVFFTQFLNLILLSAIMLRITGSRLAGFAAPVLWVINSNLAFVMAWPSAYMQILCGFCILSAFYCWLRYIESGGARWALLQGVAFTTGFLVIETTLVYPAIAAAYALLFSRRHLRKTIPLFVGSFLVFLIHMVAIPKSRSGEYALHFDLSIFQTLFTYWNWALVARNYSAITGWSESAVTAARVALTVCLLGAASWLAWRRRFVPVFFLAVFVILLGPVLPLRDHLSDYYLTLPALGLGALAAYLLAAAFGELKTADSRGETAESSPQSGPRIAPRLAAWRRRWWAITIAAALLVLFIHVQWTAARFSVRWWHDRSRQIEHLAKGIAVLRALTPERPVVVSGITDLFYWGCLHHNCLEALGVSDVYLDERSIRDLELRYPEVLSRRLRALTVPPHLLRQPGVPFHPWSVSVVSDQLRLLDSPATQPPPNAGIYLDIGSAAATPYLGSGWYSLEGTRRWMAGRATIRLPGPLPGAKTLLLSGYCPRLQTDRGPLSLRVLVDDVPLGSSRLTQGDRDFEFSVPFPPNLRALRQLEIKIEVDRTIRAPGDARDLGVVFGALEIR